VGRAAADHVSGPAGSPTVINVSGDVIDETPLLSPGQIGSMSAATPDLVDSTGVLEPRTWSWTLTVRDAYGNTTLLAGDTETPGIGVPCP